MEEIKALLVAFEEWKLAIYQDHPMMLETDDDDVAMMFMSSDSFKSKFSHLLKVVRSCKCDFCNKEFDHEPYIGGNMREKKFCSYHCQENDYMQNHDYFSDADNCL